MEWCIDKSIWYKGSISNTHASWSEHNDEPNILIVVLLWLVYDTSWTYGLIYREAY